MCPLFWRELMKLSGVLRRPSQLEDTPVVVEELIKTVFYVLHTVCPTDIEPTSCRWEPYSGTWTPTWEPGPKQIPSMGHVLGNLDLYQGALNSTRAHLCTQVPEYNTEIWLNIYGTYYGLFLDFGLLFWRALMKLSGVLRRPSQLVSTQVEELIKTVFYVLHMSCLHCHRICSVGTYQKQNLQTHSPIVISDVINIQPIHRVWC